jgi:RNA polymerase sigma-70 factor (ECF subfamily)
LDFRRAILRAEEVRRVALGARGVAIVTEDTAVVVKTQPTDSELVLRAVDGDLSAYGELVNRHQRAVYSLVSRMVMSRDDVDDLVQDVFVLAYKSLGNFRRDAAFSTWLHRIAVNTSIKHIRKMKIRQTTSVDDCEFLADAVLVSAPEEGPAVIAEDSERRESVRRAVEKLPEKHRVVVTLRYFEDRTCEEIAAILDCSVGTVWSRLHYACKQLRGQLGWLETA